MVLKFDSKYAEQFIDKNELESIRSEMKCAHEKLVNKSGAGNDFLGWVDLPV